MNAEILIWETQKKVREILNGNLDEIFVLYRQFIAAYELCEGDEDQLEDLKDIKNYLEEAMNCAIASLSQLKKIERF